MFLLYYIADRKWKKHSRKSENSKKEPQKKKHDTSTKKEVTAASENELALPSTLSEAKYERKHALIVYFNI